LWDWRLNLSRHKDCCPSKRPGNGAVLLDEEETRFRNRIHDEHPATGSFCQPSDLAGDEAIETEPKEPEAEEMAKAGAREREARDTAAIDTAEQAAIEADETEPTEKAVNRPLDTERPKNRYKQNGLS
jgi:hypothetical protein